jgi:hypothetical protein
MAKLDMSTIATASSFYPFHLGPPPRGEGGYHEAHFSTGKYTYSTVVATAPTTNCCSLAYSYTAAATLVHSFVASRLV